MPEVMGPPIVWLASDEAAGVHDERIVATEFDRWLRERSAARHDHEGFYPGEGLFAYRCKNPS